MPKIYSIDLREKVMQHYRETKHKSNTCKTFKISRSTLDDWIRLEKKTGALKQPKLNIGRPPVIKDMNEFRAFAENTPCIHVKDLQVKFEQKFGHKITYATLLKALHKIDWVQNRKRLLSKQADTTLDAEQS